jgi:FkbM family methyltransferase
MEEIKARLDSIVAMERELETVLQTLVLNDSTIIDALAQMLGAIQQMQTRAEQTQNQLADEIRSLSVQIQANGKGLGNQTVLTADEFTRENPDVGLLEYLYSFLENSNAIDIGANVGMVSDRLLKAGYSVYAFEPYAPAFQTLQHKLGSNKGFHACQFAIGSLDGTMDFHIASDLSGKGKWDPTLYNSLIDHPMLDDCKFTQTVSVRVRSLESLRRTGEIPQSAGLLKIDTEGFDLEVIRGMGDARYPVVMTEFWDSEHPFGLSGNGKLQDTVAEMKARGYAWHVVIYHVDETSTLSYYLNRDQTGPKSWGNAIFFQDHTVFVRAADWCEKVLPHTLHR